MLGEGANQVTHRRCAYDGCISDDHISDYCVCDDNISDDCIRDSHRYDDDNTVVADLNLGPRDGVRGACGTVIRITGIGIRMSLMQSRI